MGASSCLNEHVDGMYILQMQTSPSYFHSDPRIFNTEHSRENRVFVSKDLDSASTKYIGSGFVNNLEKLIDQKSVSNFSGDHNGAGGTGIKIRTRQLTRRPSSESFATHQGMAPRRIRLQRKISPGKLMEASYCDGKEETKPTITLEIANVPEKKSCLTEFENDNEEITREPTAKLLLRVKDGKSLLISDAPVYRGFRSSSIYVYLFIFVMLIITFMTIYIIV